VSHQAALDAALADKVETQCAEAVKAGRMFRSLHKKGTDVVVEGGKKVEPSSPVPSPLTPTTAPAIIQQVCAKLSQHDQNYYVMDEMSTRRGACMYETNACLPVCFHMCLQTAQTHVIESDLSINNFTRACITYVTT